MTTPGYLLPEGEAYTAEFCAMLVCYPDKPEYRQALLGTLTYLGTWLAWERDTLKRGKDAARAWKEANSHTLECLEMGCLDSLINDVQTIRVLLQNKKDCCDTSVTYGNQPEVTTTIDPGVGDPPAFWGETPITTWEDWEGYVCYHAHAYVDKLVSMAQQMEYAIDNSVWFLGLVAGALALLSFTGIGLPISFAVGATVLGLMAALSSGAFDGVDDTLESARDDIVCAIMLGGDLSAVIMATLGEFSIAWTTFFTFIDYGSAQAIIYEGGYNGEYLATETSDECDCVAPTGIYLTGVGGIQTYISDDLGGSWTLIQDYGQIAFDTEYWFLGQSNTARVVTLDGVGGPRIDVQAQAITTGLPPGNGLYWYAEKADTTIIENQVLRIMPGDYPFSYAQVSYINGNGNNVNYPSGYPIKLKYYAYP